MLWQFSLVGAGKFIRADGKLGGAKHRAMREENLLDAAKGLETGLEAKRYQDSKRATTEALVCL